MNIEEAKYRADIYVAYANGKTVECKVKYNLKGWRTMTKDEDFDFAVYQYRIKPDPITRLMNHQELSDWLRDEPQEYRECKYKGETTVWHSYAYNEDEAIIPCETILIRKNHGKWMEPIIEVEK